MSRKSKQQRNYKGRIRAEEKKFEAEFTYGQVEIGEIIGVDPRTVARWCGQGLTHERGAPGKEHRIELRTAIHWSIGHKWAEKKGLDVSALEKMLWALSYAFIGGKENPSFSKWRLQMIQETDWFNATQQEITFAIGRLTGLGCLPFRQSRW